MKQSIVDMVWIGDITNSIESLRMKPFVKNGMHVKLIVYNLVRSGYHKKLSCVM